LADCIAAPAALLAQGVIGIVDRLGGAGADVRVGTPPTSTALMVGLTCVALIALMGYHKK
jgi:hypothetical protein